MLRLKKSTDIRGMRPELVLAMHIADQVWVEHGSEQCVVTSVTDGSHSRNSLHYVGLAFDLRIWAWKDDAAAVQGAAVDLQGRLGDSFDVVVESSHVHVEYQPEDAVNA